MIAETLIEMEKKWENQGIRKGIRKGIQKGRQEGLQKGRHEAALNTATELLKEGLSVEFIARVTGLSQKEVEQIKKKLP